MSSIQTTIITCCLFRIVNSRHWTSKIWTSRTAHIAIQESQQILHIPNIANSRSWPIKYWERYSLARWANSIQRFKTFVTCRPFHSNRFVVLFIFNLCWQSSSKQCDMCTIGELMIFKSKSNSLVALKWMEKSKMRRILTTQIDYACNKVGRIEINVITQANNWLNIWIALMFFFFAFAYASVATQLKINLTHTHIGTSTFSQKRWIHFHW